MTDKCYLSLDSGGQGWSITAMSYQTHGGGEPHKTNNASLPALGRDGEPEIYPAHIRDNPIMQGAFSAFMNWIWLQDGAHDAHCAATNMAPLATNQHPINVMIDKSTGYAEAYAASFLRWAIDTQWGVEGRDEDAAAQGGVL